MRNIGFIFILFLFFINCQSNKQIEKRFDPNVSIVEKDTIEISHQVESFSDNKVTETTSDVLCDIETVLYVSQNLENLTKNDIIKFLNVFGHACKNNVEFLQFSNETLFKLIQKDVNLYMSAWKERGISEIELVMNEIKYPLLDYNYQRIYDSIKVSNAPKDLIKYHLEALRDAAKIDYIELKE
jgi:hypothetical protein